MFKVVIPLGVVIDAAARGTPDAAIHKQLERSFRTASKSELKLSIRACDWIKSENHRNFRALRLQEICRIWRESWSNNIRIAKHLKGDGEIYLFDYQYNVDYVGEILQSNGFSNFHRFGSSSKLLDSYNWPLSRLLEKQSGPLFDYCFLDGAHIWNIDALTFFLVDRLLAVGGYVDFDDYNWSLAVSPTLAPHLFPKTSEFYTDEQIKDRQVKRVVDLLVKTSPRYVEIVENKIYQKIANEGESSSFAKMRSIWRQLLLPVKRLR